MEKPSNATDTPEFRREAMEKVENDVIGFTSSALVKERIKNNVLPVIGDGDHFAKIIFIGEAPGKNEAKTGKPFCGASGRILDELLASINLPRQSVYITNIVKDRPPENRDPTPVEIEGYSPFLDRQIEIIKPKVIATLGRFSMAYIIKKFGLESELDVISKMHGRTFEAKTSFGSLKIVPLYHPAVALYNVSTKGELIKDFKILANLV